MTSEARTIRLTPDATELTAVLATLRKALSEPFLSQSLGGIQTWAEDRNDLVRRIQETVRAARASDLRDVAVPESPVDHSWGLDLARTLNTLRAALERELKRHLGDEGPAALVSLLQDSAPDFLAILRKEHDENTHSAVIRWLLDPRTAPTVGPRLLHGLVSAYPNASEWSGRIAAAIHRNDLTVRREVLVGREVGNSADLDRSDILVASSDFGLVLENKTRSKEHSDQTRTYWVQLSAWRLRAGVFLTPDGSPATCPGFRPLSYVEFLAMLVQASRAGGVTGAEKMVLASYVKALSGGILSRQIQLLGGS